MIAYGVMVTKKVSDYRLDLGVKGQGQIYLDYTMSHSFYTYVASSTVFSFSHVQIIYFPNIYFSVFQSSAPKWILLSNLYSAVFLPSCYLQYSHSKFVNHSALFLSFSTCSFRFCASFPSIYIERHFVLSTNYYMCRTTTHIKNRHLKQIS